MTDPDGLDVWDYDWVWLGLYGKLIHAPVFTPEERRFFSINLDGPGSTACGRHSDYLSVPGVLSRLSAKRCPRCCVAVGIPAGVGSPKNDDECRRILGLSVKGAEAAFG